MRSIVVILVTVLGMSLNSSVASLAPLDMELIGVGGSQAAPRGGLLYGNWSGGTCVGVIDAAPGQWLFDDIQFSTSSAPYTVGRLETPVFIYPGPVGSLTIGFFTPTRPIPYTATISDIGTPLAMFNFAASPGFWFLNIDFPTTVLPRTVWFGIRITAGSGTQYCLGGAPTIGASVPGNHFLYPPLLSPPTPSGRGTNGQNLAVNFYVPEPSTALLIAAAGWLVLRRRPLMNKPAGGGP